MERLLRSSVAQLNEFAQGVIDERRQKPGIDDQPDLLTRYLNMTDEDGKPFSDQYLRDIIMNFMYHSPMNSWMT